MYNTRRFLRVGAIIAAAMIMPAARAFIIIDTAGPRELIAPAGVGEKLSARSVKLSTKDKSLTGFFLWHRGHQRPAAPIEESKKQTSNVPSALTFTGGITAKLTATDGVEEFLKFDRMPANEIGVLWNVTHFPGPAEKAIQSVTLQGGMNSAEILHVPTTLNPQQEVRTARNRSTYFQLAYGAYWRNVPVVRQISFVLSAEARRASNVEDLPKVTVGELSNLAGTGTDGATRVTVAKSRIVRWGDLEFGATFPLTVALVLSHPADFVGELFTDDATKTRLFWAPYYRYTASSRLGDAKAAGVSLTVRTKTPVDGKPDKLEFPLSVYFEEATEPGGRRWKSRVGASVVFTWGP